MATTIVHKRSALAGAVPTVEQLAAGELAINTTDGKIFLRKVNGEVIALTDYIADGGEIIIPPQLAKVPLEDSGGAGTESSHWEDNYRNSSYPGSDGFNYPGVIDELMVGSISPGTPRLLSKLSIGSLVDFGYVEINPGSSEGNPSLAGATLPMLAQSRQNFALNCRCQNNVAPVCVKIITPPENVSAFSASSAPILFNKNSWSPVQEPYKTYLDQAADRWGTYLAYDPATVATIRSLSNWSNWEGLRLGSINIYTDIISSTVASCGPINYVIIQNANLAVPKFQSLNFLLNINAAYLNTFSASDWLNIMTHELGHALGIGIYWQSSFANVGAVPPSNFFLDGNYYVNAKNAYVDIVNSTAAGQ
jgi:hypothetical protein